MPDASSELKDENNGRNDASCSYRVNHVTPDVKRTAKNKMLKRWPTDRDLNSFFSCSIAGSDLHLHDFLVRRYHFVAHLQEHLEFQLGSLRRDRHRVQFVTAARQKRVHRMLCRVLAPLYAPDVGLQHRLKIAARLGRCCERGC